MFAGQNRASGYRGVSKNGPNWQVLFMCHGKKIYKGGLETELSAAKVYDEIAIRANGIKVNSL